MYTLLPLSQQFSYHPPRSLSLSPCAQKCMNKSVRMYTYVQLRIGKHSIYVYRCSRCMLITSYHLDTSL